MGNPAYATTNERGEYIDLTNSGLTPLTRAEMYAEKTENVFSAPEVGRPRYTLLNQAIYSGTYSISALAACVREDMTRAFENNGLMYESAPVAQRLIADTQLRTTSGKGMATMMVPFLQREYRRVAGKIYTRKLTPEECTAIEGEIQRGLR